MQPSVIVKPTTKQELSKALNQADWKFVASREVVNASDLREVMSLLDSLVRARKKKLCLAIIERS
jgi:hypothetical protein